MFQYWKLPPKTTKTSPIDFLKYIKSDIIHGHDIKINIQSSWLFRLAPLALQLDNKQIPSLQTQLILRNPNKYQQSISYDSKWSDYKVQYNHQLFEGVQQNTVESR